MREREALIDSGESCLLMVFLLRQMYSKLGYQKT